MVRCWCKSTQWPLFAMSTAGSQCQVRASPLSQKWRNAFRLQLASCTAKRHSRRTLATLLRHRSVRVRRHAPVGAATKLSRAPCCQSVADHVACCPWSCLSWLAPALKAADLSCQPCFLLPQLPLIATSLPNQALVPGRVSSHRLPGTWLPVIQACSSCQRTIWAAQKLLWWLLHQNGSHASHIPGSPPFLSGKLQVLLADPWCSPARPSDPSSWQWALVPVCRTFVIKASPWTRTKRSGIFLSSKCCDTVFLS